MGAVILTHIFRCALRLTELHIPLVQLALVFLPEAIIGRTGISSIRLGLPLIHRPYQTVTLTRREVLAQPLILTFGSIRVWPSSCAATFPLMGEMGST